MNQRFDFPACRALNLIFVKQAFVLGLYKKAISPIQSSTDAVA